MIYADRNWLAKKNRHNLKNQRMDSTPILGAHGCLVNEFRCNNGECIPAEKRCDLLIGKNEDDSITL